MSDKINEEKLHYLPVEVTGQLLAFDMADVIAVQLLDSPLRGETADTVTREAQPDSVPVIDLGQLFWGEASDGERAYSLVIVTKAGTCAVLVDGVHPARRAAGSSFSRLPQLAALRGCPFKGVVRDSASLIPVIDSQLLVTLLQQITADLVVEPAATG